MSNLVAVADRVDETRNVVVDVENVGPVVAAWMVADGGAAGGNVARLVGALRRGDWSRVHAIADHLSIDVDAIAGVL